MHGRRLQVELTRRGFAKKGGPGDLVCLPGHLCPPLASHSGPLALCSPRFGIQNKKSSERKINPSNFRSTLRIASFASAVLEIYRNHILIASSSVHRSPPRITGRQPNQSKVFSQRKEVGPCQGSEAMESLGNI